MAASPEAPDRIISADSAESPKMLAVETEEKPADSEGANEQPLSTKEEQLISPDVTLDASAMGTSRDVTSQSGLLEASGERNTFNPPNVYAPQAFYYGYESTSGEWDDYPQYVNAEGLEIGSPGVYNENPSILYHPPYGYSPQMPYGPYSPVTTPLPSARGDGQLYPAPQQFPFTGPYYQQSVPHSMPYITSQSPASQQELPMPSAIDQQGAFVADASNSNNMLFGPRPAYPLPYGSFGRGSFGGSVGNLGYYDLRQGFDGFGSGGPWSDWSKSSDGQQRSFSPLSSPAASPQPIATLGSFGHNIAPLMPGTVSQQHRPLYGMGPTASSYNRSYTHSGIYHQGSNFGRPSPGLATNDRSWIAVDKGRRRGRGSGSLCSCNGTLDVLSEQNRGPRASKPKNPQTEQNSSSIDSKTEASIAEDSREHNRPDFATEYKDAKFFIIKSYSEDNVHKSIKYGVWASTPNGNRKLDSAYRESKEKEGPCPVFLLFSVNASAQFCGVAEMMGPVDFDRSVDYWQQDKWSGQFPVKWHIIKDVPNNQFRHIILESNDNKPVTNSRDTQEVKLEQGIEILNIFKNYDSNLSILDDFDFYESREKLMQERKASQQGSLTSPATPSSELKTTPTFSGKFINQMSKSFANAVRLEEGKEIPTTENGGSATATKDLTQQTLQTN